MSKITFSIGRLARSSLFQDASLVFITNFGSAFILFIATILLARIWGVTTFGVLNSLFGISSLAVGLTDLGVTLTTIRLVAKYKNVDEPRYEFVKAMVPVLEGAL